MSGIIQTLFNVNNPHGWTDVSYLFNSVFGTSQPIASAYGNGIYVVVGTSGTCIYSNNGTNWYNSSLYSVWGGDAIQSVCFRSSNNTFYAVGEYGKCAYSTDGSSWSMLPAFTTAFNSAYTAYSIATDGTLLMVVGVNGRCATSSDGSTWTYRSDLASTVSNNSMFRLCYNGTKYYAAGEYGKSATSTSSLVWVDASAYTTAFGSSGFTTGIASNGNNLVAVGQNIGEGGSNVCVTSSNIGVNWALNTNFTSIFSGTPRDVTWVGDRFMVVGDSKQVASTSNLTNWNFETACNNAYSLAAGGSGNMYTICANGSNILITGSNSSTGTAAILYQ